jgi:hypothetical protein
LKEEREQRGIIRALFKSFAARIGGELTSGGGALAEVECDATVQRLVIGDVCSTKLREGNSALESLATECFWITAMKVCGNGYEHGYRIRADNADGVWIRRQGAAFGDEPDMNLESDSVMAAAMHALVGVTREDEGLVVGGNRARQDGFAKAHAAVDAPGPAAGEANSENVVRV